ncbi:uncharacterized protein LOC111359682 [Spodoptera litura]|uniref:Uncharacterized protein LOC111359682 n=1 Tax=Spodoptera litura TaxID=69820 RepID=A0A9J7EHD1_SPOLT|nr:uncharacterized protein LOC111359682 [Spodoptera litura]
MLLQAKDSASLLPVAEHWFGHMQNKTGYKRQPFPNRQNEVLSSNDDSTSIIDFPQTQRTQAELLTVPVPCDQIDRSEHNISDINLEYEAVSETNDNNIDLLHPIISNKENLCIISDKNTCDAVFVEPKVNNVDDINWDDMLDSELFVKIAAGGETDCEELHEDHNFTMGSTFNLNRVSCVGKENKYKKKSKRTKQKSDRSAKQRKSINNAEESHSKVIVEMKQTNKNNLRKQKYTKAIKNWLDNVESPHLMCGNVDKDCINELKGGDKDDIRENTEPNKHLTQMFNTPDKEIHLDKAQPAMRTAKKVVQAQLANKNGIMKYSKPKILENRPHTESATQQSTTKDNRNKVTKKFVAPIKYQTVEGVKFQVHLVDEENILSFNDSLLQAKDKEIIAVLIYSNGFCQLNSHYTDDTCSPSGIIICHNAMFYCFKTPGPNLKKALSYLLTNNVVVCYDARSVLMFLASHLELDIGTIDMRDAKIGATLLDPDNPPENFSGLQRLLALSSQSSSVLGSTECSLQKSSWYMSQLKECWVKLLDMLIEHSLWDVFIEIEMKLIPIITAMELRGVCVDMKTLNSMEQAVVDRLTAVEARCYEVAGRVFQVSSPAQVRALLYDELRLDEECNLDVGGTEAKGAKSTCETTLRRLAAVSQHELPRLVLEYRHLHKAHATFLAGIAQHVRDGVVRPTWLQMASATGRIAASNPNLQAIPKAPFSLFLFPGADDESASSFTERASSVTERASSITERESSITERASSITERESSITERESSVTERASSVTECASSTTERASSVTERASSVTERESSVTERASSTTERASSVTERASSTTERASSVTERASSTTERASSVTERASSTTERASSTTERASSTTERASSVTERACPALQLRACYVARPGRRLLAADFRHIECRVFAHLAADTRLLHALAQPRDFFTQLAADWLKKPESEVVAEERERTKRLVYASLYGAGPRKLMEILGVSYQRALEVAASFHSSAADVCKMAMVATTRALDAADAALVLQVHDELVWEVDEHRLHDAAGRVQRAMEQCGRECGLSVPLPVSLRAGADWARMEPYTV